MIANTCGMTEAYNKIVSECYPEREAYIKMRCAEYLDEYCQKKRMVITLADEGFFRNYFTKWLPYAVCLEDREVIDSFYSAADEYIRLTDMINGTSVHKRFKMLDKSVKYESARLMLLKRRLLDYSESFVISKLPCVIDIDRYRMKKAGDNAESERDSGKFIVESAFSKNSAVMRRLGGYEYYIRLFFNAEIMELIHEND
ncbi:MAG: hypothetical protein LUE88_02345, partial [Clostridiales bacterium]|nr:hypothetical protein [Clostridiales bacterium]